MIDQELKDAVALFSILASVVDSFVFDDFVKFFKHQTVRFGIPSLFGRNGMTVGSHDGSDGGRGGSDILN